MSSKVRAAMAATALAGAILVFAAALATGATGASASWNFDEGAGTTVYDGVGNLDGTIEGATWITGHSGKALRFENDRVAFADDPVLTSPALSIQLWVRGNPASPPASGQVILEKGGLGCETGSYALFVDGGHVALRYRDVTKGGEMRTASVGSASLPSLWDGAWHQIVFKNVDGDWGTAELYQQGWGVSALHYDTDPDHGIEYANLDLNSFTIGGAVNSACGTPGFTGDIDDVSVYPRTLTLEELAAAEPVVSTALSVESIDPLKVDEGGYARVKVSPFIAPGRLRVYLTGGDGIERLAGGAVVDGLWEVPADGVVRAGIRPQDGGQGVVRFRWEPAAGGHQPSTATAPVTVAKAWSDTNINAHGTYIDGEPMQMAVRVGTSAHVEVRGTVEIWERKPSGATRVASLQLEDTGGTYDSFVAFTIPPRPAGTIELESRYLGSTAHLPSVSAPLSIEVNQKLQTGEVRINGGAAVTDSPYVVVEVPATGARAVQLATQMNGARREFSPVTWEPTKATVLNQTYYGDDQDGVRAVLARWSDALGRWSAWKSDTIVLDRGIESGTVTINGGAAQTDTNLVTVSAPVDNPSAVVSVQLSNDGRAWSTYPYGQSITWALAGGDGERTVQARWVDAQGRQSVSATDSIVVDKGPPSITSVTARFITGLPVTDGVPVRIEWIANAPEEISGFDVAISRNGGTWKSVVKNTTALWAIRNLAPGNSYRFRVRPRDTLGVRGAWHVTSSQRLTDIQESSPKIAYTGTWAKATGLAYWRGATRHSSSANASASVTVTGTAFAWVSGVGPTRGSARIFIDGQLAATVDLWKAYAAKPKVIFDTQWSDAAARTIRIEVVGSSGHPRVDSDGFVTIQPSP